MIYTYDEFGPSATKAVMITGFTVVRADSPDQGEIMLNVSDGTVLPDGTINWTGRRNPTIATSNIKLFSALMSDLYSGLVTEKKIAPPKVTPGNGKVK